MHTMRTTVNLPDLLHARALEMARASNRSLSSILADLVAAGMHASAFESHEPLRRSAITGMPVVHTGRRITAREVAELLDEDDR